MRYRSKLCSRKDSPLVINPLWSVSSFRNSSLISCSSFLENASIDLVVRKQNCQKNWHQKKWHQRYLLALGLLNNQKRKSPKLLIMIQPLPPPWWPPTICWTRKSQSSHFHPCPPDIKSMTTERMMMMFLVFYMATILSRNSDRDKKYLAYQYLAYQILKFWNSDRDQKYLAYQAPGLSLCHTSPNLRANTHGTHFHSNFKTGIDMFIGPNQISGFQPNFRISTKIQHFDQI